MRCPNPDCSYAKKHARAAEYRSGMTTCSDCGAALVEDNAEAPSSSAASAPVRNATRASEPMRPITGALWAAMAVSAVVVLLGPVLTLVPLPYIDVDALRAAYGHVAGGGFLGLFDGGGALPQLSAGAIGFTPWLTGMLVVELVALAIPAWRSLRHGGPEGRAKLARAATVIGFLFACFQAVLLTRWVASNVGGGEYGSYGYAFAEIAPELYGLGPQALFALTIVAGSCLLRLAVVAVERAGLGNGFALLFAGAALSWACSALARTALRLSEGSIPPLYAGGALIVLVAVVVAVLKYVKPADADDPDFVAQPSAGMVPFDTGVGANTMLVSAAALLGKAVAPTDLEPLIVGAVVALVTVPMFAALFSSTSRAALVHARLAGRDAANEADREAARASSSPALSASVVLQVILVGSWLIGTRLHITLDILGVVVTVATLRDLAGELRARRAFGDVVAVWPFHRFDHMNAALHALHAEGIEAFPRGAHLRVLGHFFMPWIPVELLVAAADADRARGVVASLVGKLAAPAPAPSRA